MDISSDLAAASYAASLQPDPTLDPESDPSALDAYHERGRMILNALRSGRRALIRCDLDPRPGQRSRLLATVHDRWLLVIRDFRGPDAFGLRLVRHLLVDLRMAQREGYRAVTMFCPREERHEFRFRWLRSATGYAMSDRVDGPFYKAPGTYLDADLNPVPEEDRDAYFQAFAVLTGPLDQSFFVALTPLRAAWWWTRYGPDDPQKAHFDRLTARHDFRAETHNARSIPTMTWAEPDAAAATIRSIEEAHR